MEFKKSILSLSIIMIVLPVICFFIGFLKIYLSIPLTLLTLYFCYKVIKNEEIKINIGKKNILILLLLIILLVLFSGIGSFSFQNVDHAVRNAIFRDLINYKWPVIYDYSNSKYLDLFETDKAGLVYYFTYWLPSAIVGKLFGIKVANVFLVLYSSFCLLLVIFMIHKKSNLNILLCFLIFVAFSGFDILLNKYALFSIMHLEWGYPLILQYSSNVTQLYWVFNQSIEIWLIISLILNLKKNSSIIFISCLSFCYSPFATFGVIPIVLCLLFLNNKDKIFIFIKNIVCSLEFLYILCILVVFGSYYLSSTSSIQVSGFAWNTLTDNFVNFIVIYLSFISTEFIFYYLVLRNSYKKDVLFNVIIIELILIPFYVLTPGNDFCMRASIGPLFILFIYVLSFFKENKSKFCKYALIVMLLIGSVTPMHEIARSVYYTHTKSRDEYIENSIYSISEPRTLNGAKRCNAQFFSKNYQDTFFFKYLGK